MSDNLPAGLESASGAIEPFCKTSRIGEERARKVCFYLAVAEQAQRQAATSENNWALETTSDEFYEEPEPSSTAALLLALANHRRASLNAAYAETAKFNQEQIPIERRCPGCYLFGIVEGQVAANSMETPPTRQAITAQSTADSNLEP